MNIRDIFKDSKLHEENAECSQHPDELASDRKMYCPVCYKDFYTDSDVCPECGNELEPAMTEEEEAEYVEMFFGTRV